MKWISVNCGVNGFMVEVALHLMRKRQEKERGVWFAMCAGCVRCQWRNKRRMTSPVLKGGPGIGGAPALKCLCASLLRESNEFILTCWCPWAPFERCLNTADAGSNLQVYLILDHRNVYRWVRSRAELFITPLQQRGATKSCQCPPEHRVTWQEEKKRSMQLTLTNSINVR